MSLTPDAKPATKSSAGRLRSRHHLTAEVRDLASSLLQLGGGGVEGLVRMLDPVHERRPCRVQIVGAVLGGVLHRIPCIRGSVLDRRHRVAERVDGVLDGMDQPAEPALIVVLLLLLGRRLRRTPHLLEGGGYRSVRGRHR
jgi:hypothetical protein